MSRISVETLEPVGRYGTSEVCKMAEVTYRQLDYWDRSGLLTPSVQVASGSGSTRYYSAYDVALVTAIRILRDAGVTLDAIRRVVNSKDPEKVLAYLKADIEQAERLFLSEDDATV